MPAVLLVERVLGVQRKSVRQELLKTETPKLLSILTVTQVCIILKVEVYYLPLKVPFGCS